jgi:Divergent InlB B-repeat domain
LTASPGSGSTFTGWSGGGCSGTGTCTVTMSSDQAVTATFSAVGPPSDTLTVALGGSGSGSVSGGGISCPGTCSRSFPSGTMVTLTASPGSGSMFAGWSGGGCSGTGTCTVTMSSDQSVTATFTASSGLGCRGFGPALICHYRVHGPIVNVPVRCFGFFDLEICRITFKLTITESLKGGKVIAVSASARTQKRTVIVGTKSLTLAAGDSETARVGLDAAGQRLLKSRHKLSVKFTATARRANGTMVGLSRQTIEFKAPSKKKK